MGFRCDARVEIDVNAGSTQNPAPRLTMALASEHRQSECAQSSYADRRCCETRVFSSCLRCVIVNV